MFLSHKYSNDWAQGEAFKSSTVPYWSKKSNNPQTTLYVTFYKRSNEGNLTDITKCETKSGKRSTSFELLHAHCTVRIENENRKGALTACACVDDTKWFKCNKYL